jgi:hypothetical protein
MHVEMILLAAFDDSVAFGRSCGLGRQHRGIVACVARPDCFVSPRSFDCCNQMLRLLWSGLNLPGQVCRSEEKGQGLGRMRQSELFVLAFFPRLPPELKA